MIHSVIKKVKAVLFCDAVRREDNGKFIAIGCYGSSVVVHEFPVQLVLTPLIQCDLSKVEELTGLSFKLSISGSPASPKLEGQITTAKEEKNGLLPVGPFAIEVKRPGTLKLQLLSTDGVWATIGSIPIVNAADLRRMEAVA